MLKIIKKITIFSSLTFLTACGGGGGGGATAPVSSVKSFNIQAAYTAFIQQSGNFNFSLTGIVNNIPVTGSGTVRAGSLLPSTFEGNSAFSKSYTVTGSLNGNGNTTSLASSSTDYFMQPAGSEEYVFVGTQDSQFLKAMGMSPFPIAGKVNTSGSWYSGNNYYDSYKTINSGTTSAEYSITPDTADSVIFTTVETYKRSGSNSIITTMNYRVTSANEMSLISSSVYMNMHNDNQQLTLTYR